MSALVAIAPGLRRWTAWHEEWSEDVGSLAVETADGLVLIDPLEPPSELGTPEHVLVTVFWHTRSTRDVGARRVWAPRRSAQPLRNRGIDVTDPFGPADDLPGGIRAFATPRVSELVFWLPEQRAVVAGDVLLGAGARPGATSAPLRLCPERWLGTKATHDDLREALLPLLELPVQRVLVSHGKPVLRNGKRALAAVLAG
jgi:glyoxylase-like metal-dependent hydrolase (beta-lactamase superfamily II)